MRAKRRKPIELPPDVARRFVRDMRASLAERDGINNQIAPRLQVGSACQMFFIDETGHETFADKNYPVFGLGGCAIISSLANAVVAQPWRAMKAAHFGGGNVPLHANELRKPTPEQLDALSKFFRVQRFAPVRGIMGHARPHPPLRSRATPPCPVAPARPRPAPLLWRGRASSNTAEGWSRDVTIDIADQLRRR